MTAYKACTGTDASVMLLQNHGIFIAADDEQTLESKLSNVMDTLHVQLKETPDFSPCNSENGLTDEFKDKIVSLYGEGSFAVFDGSRQAAAVAESRESAAPLLRPFTPDHIVYCKAHPLFVESLETLDEAFAEYKTAHGYAPKIIMAKGLGFFAASETEKQAETARRLFNDAMKIAVYSKSFGGALHMTDELTDFIINWEVESYRSSRNK